MVIPNWNHRKTIVIGPIIAFGNFENYGSIELMKKLILIFNYRNFPKILSTCKYDTFYHSQTACHHFCNSLFQSDKQLNHFNGITLYQQQPIGSTYKFPLPIINFHKSLPYKHLGWDQVFFCSLVSCWLLPYKSYLWLL